MSVANSDKVDQPRSKAASREFNNKPRLVGDMRCATNSSCAWTTSGINQFSAALLNSRKKRHVCSVTPRSMVRPFSFSLWRLTEEGWFNQSQSVFEELHSARNGRATKKEEGRRTATK